jgi:protein O-GlcNAc transferase
MTDLRRAMTLWQSGRRLEAEREIERLLAESPDSTLALKSLAEIYAASGRTAQSIDLWREAARRFPGDAGILRQLAQALLAQDSLAEAIESLRAAIAIEPDHARACSNLGLALLRAGEPAQARASLEQAVAIDPGYALGHMNLGVARQQLGDPEGARASFERAVHCDPNLPHARAYLSEALRAVDPGAALRERARALESHAINLMSVRRHDEAVAIWTQVIESGADVAYARGDRFHCRLFCCDWSAYEETSRALQAAVASGERADRPFSFFVYSHSAQSQLTCSRTFVADRHPALSEPAPVEIAPGSDRIKVAYLSFDFHEHATAYLIAGLLECHDRSRFEVFALSYGENDQSPMRARLTGSVERFVDVSKLSDAAIGDWLRAERIQIAVDLKGLTGGARTGILASRPAPLQINFLGYPGTMGAPYIDYIVADPIVIPVEDQGCYSEQVIYLPRCYQPNDAMRALPAEGPGRASCGLPQGGFIFCCFNNLYKITPRIFAAWMELLRVTGGSVLWLLEGTAAAMDNLRAHAAAHGVARERLIFAPHIPLSQHLARYRHADLFLDTAPCNAHTTASDSLWMGVPVLTLTGTTFAGRVATSLLHAVGLPELCTNSIEDYVSRASHLARTPGALSALKGHLENGRLRFSLFDTAAYCRDLEAAYLAIWERHARGGQPAALALERASHGEQHP